MRRACQPASSQRLCVRGIENELAYRVNFKHPPELLSLAPRSSFLLPLSLSGRSQSEPSERASCQSRFLINAFVWPWRSVCRAQFGPASVAGGLWLVACGAEEQVPRQESFNCEKGHDPRKWTRMSNALCLFGSLALRRCPRASFLVSFLSSFQASFRAAGSDWARLVRACL